MNTYFTKSNQIIILILIAVIELSALLNLIPLIDIFGQDVRIYSVLLVGVISLNNGFIMGVGYSLFHTVAVTYFFASAGIVNQSPVGGPIVLISLSALMGLQRFRINRIIASLNESIEQSQALSQIVENVEDIAVIKDLDLRVISANIAYARAAGKESVDQLTGKTDAEIFGVNETDEPVASYMRDERRAQSLAKGEQIVTEEDVIFPDGSRHVYLTRKFPIYDQNETLIATANISTDISPRKAAEEKLKWHEQLMHHTLQSIQEGICVLDRDLNVILTNHVLDQWHQEGLPFRSKKCYHAFFGEDKPCEDCPVEMTLQTGQMHHVESVRQVNQGTRIMEIFAYPMKDEDGSVTGVVEFLRDITHRKMIEQELVTARVEAENANKAKSAFLANMSHEIRTPLNAIIGLTELAVLSDNFDEIKDYLKTVNDSGRHLLSIINDVLDFSKIESGKFILDNSTFSLWSMLKTITQTYEYITAASDLEFVTEFSSSLPEYIAGDEMRIRQVLLNLLSNAVKFTSDGSVTLIVDAEKISDEQYNVSFIVADTGIGIPVEKQKEIFYEFQQADSSVSRKYGGTGLGLSISKTIIDMMKGSLEMSSVEGEGAVFSVSIPLSTASDSDIEDTAAIFKMSHEERASIKILLAEDNRVNIKLGIRLLEKAGFSADVALNGKEVLEMINKKDYDLVLMDIEMPELDGIATTKIIRNDPRYAKSRHVPILAMTAHAVTDVRDLARDAGMTDYLTKPLQLAVFEKMIIRYLE